LFNNNSAAIFYFCYMKRIWPVISISTIIIATLIIACNDNSNGGNNGGDPPKPSPAIAYSVVNTFPHDTSSYTQGLIVYKGQLLEGTGNFGKSKLREIDLKTGKAVKEISLDPKHFGEGITVLNDTLYQLTWKEKIMHVYTARDFKKIKEFSLNTEGWGITNDGKNLIVTDGSNNLFFYEPSTFRLLRTQGVFEMGQPLDDLNELEYINGYIYANQYQFNNIYKIDPNSGLVVAKLNLADVVNGLKQSAPYVDVLNGIAYDSATKKVYITGKNWPSLYEIQFDH